MKFGPILLYLPCFRLNNKVLIRKKKKDFFLVMAIVKFRKPGLQIQLDWS